MKKNYQRRLAAGDPPLIPPHVLKFMNTLPIHGSAMDRVIQSKNALLHILGGIDRIVLFININCDLLEIDRSSNSLLIITTSSGHSPDDANLQVTTANHQELLNIYLEHLRQAGFPFEEYQRPYSVIYSMFPEGSHLGTIWLFRKRGRTPIAAHTIETMEKLRPFFLFLLSHLVASNAYIRPADVMFHRIIDELFWENALTSREREVFILKLMGLQKKSIADKLFLSQETISKHIQKILRKGKARNFLELFMRYYLPDLETMTVPSPTVKRSSRKGAKSAAKESPAREQNNLLIW